MRRLAIALLFLCPCINTYSQSLFKALHATDNSGYYSGQPLHITRIDTIRYSGNAMTTQKNRKYYDGNGMLLNEEQYDENGKLIMKITCTNNMGKKLPFKRITEIWRDNGFSKETSFFTYNENKILVEITDFDDKGRKKRVSKIVSDESGNPTEVKVFDEKGTEYAKETAEYFYEQNFVVIKVISKKGWLLSSDSSRINFRKNSSMPGNDATYNEKGETVSFAVRKPDGSKVFVEQEHSYDSRGNCISERSYEVKPKSNKKTLRVVSSIQIVYKE